MGVAWSCARSDLRRRWLSWVVLGLLAGVTVGLACAGFAGARRTARALPNYVLAVDLPDAAVLANSERYDDEARARVARLPEVERTAPFMVPYLLEVTSPAGMDPFLLPVARIPTEPLVEGRLPDPRRADEMIVNEVLSDLVGLEIGDIVTVAQPAVEDPAALPFGVPAGATEPLEATLRVVGIVNAATNEPDAMPSPGFYRRYRPQLAGFVNEFVYLRSGEDALPAFRSDVESIVGERVNVESARDLFGVPAAQKISDVEQGALVLFALAVLIGGGVLVGQALVRAVNAGAADVPTWRALGFDRRMAVSALALPASVAAVVGAATVVALAIALSPRFPVSISRRLELDLGVHADWFVLGLGVAVLVLAISATAWLTAWLKVRFGEGSASRPPLLAQWASSLSLPASMVVGTRLAVEPGRGKRAVPVRSAFVGAVAGVLGVVACFTFGRGLVSTVDDPSRSGVTWDLWIGAGELVSPDVIDAVATDDDVGGAVSAIWLRAVEIDGRSVPAFGTTTVNGDLPFVVLDGRAPSAPDEVAIAPTTMDELGLRVGNEIAIGPGSAARARVVGRALLPPTSHTAYDQSAWMTAAGLQRARPPADESATDFGESYVFVRWRAGTDVTEKVQRLTALGAEYIDEPELPPAVEGLGHLRTLPGALALFFALLGVATVAHALVTTVRRRAYDLAILRSMGLSQRDSRLAVVWQATLLAIVGLILGVPLGIMVGRYVWRLIAENFPVVYVAPLALLAVLLVIPVALLVANLLAAGPARAASRVRPAEALRSE